MMLPVAGQIVVFLVALLAMVPLVALSASIVPQTTVDDGVLAVVVSFGLWVVLPVAVSRLVGTSPQELQGGC